MKIKSIVLTAALATAFSAFSDSASVDVDWFTTNVTSVVKYFDRNINDPVVVTNGTSTTFVATDFPGATIVGYSVTSYVTNLVRFASLPTLPLDNFDTKTIKGSICATSDGWWGLSNNVEWVQFDVVAPEENSAHALKMEFTTGPKVRYSVDGGTSSSWFVSDNNVEPTCFAFAGMGGCTNIVGEVEITVASASVVPVDGGKILVVGDSVKSDNATDLDSNKLAKWVNYVLGIDGTNAEAKPYAAPVQNASSDALTFSLGGVNVGAHVTGAKVTYTVETLSSVNPVTKDNEATEPDPVDPNSSISVNVPDGVRYYRIKIKIDPAQ